jgi:Lon protease-like protein
MSSNEDSVELSSAPQGLDAHKDARAIIRLFQCSQCSYPFREPMTLPCGYSLCRPCLPPLYKRENITYPLNPGRAEGFVCPFKDCGLEHSLGDCSMDVTLNKVLDVVRSDIQTYQMKTSHTPLMLDERLHWKNIIDSSMDIMPRSRILNGGRLVATYTFADMGELSYHSDVAYTPLPKQADSIEALDVAVLEHLKEAIKIELECQVCYSLMLDPLTTSCGHTFCRQCVARVLDHSNLCPACRRVIPLQPGVQAEPSNKSISQLISGLCPDLLQLRIASATEEDTGDEDMNVALFPCTLAYPEMPTFLHIFEPRYRLMVRRAIDSGGRKFGMMMYNRRGRPQGVLGQSHFVQYGTLLHIQNIEIFPDGRSLIETQGVSRFKVLETAMRDGYIVGRIQRVDDVPLSEEEAVESRETAGPDPPPNDALGRLNHMSTQRLLQFSLDFISRAQAASEPWLAERFLSVYGPPPSDPAIFPYWFASVLPISEDEKYQLLPTTSVRERLKITARWIQRLEAARW